MHALRRCKNILDQAQWLGTSQRHSVVHVAHFVSTFPRQVGSESKGMMQSFFRSLQKMGVGKQFTLDKELLLWGQEKADNSSNIEAIMAKKASGATSEEKKVLIKEWKIFNDSEYGGHSKCEVRINPRTSVVTFAGEVRQGKPEVETNETAKTNNPLGRNATTPQKAVNSTASPAGYCALTGYCGSPVDLINFEGIELMIRTNKPANFLFR